MKNKLGILMFAIIVIGFSGFVYYRETSICRKPLAYDLGSIDSRFNISRDKIISTTEVAEDIWEKGLNRQLFSYQPKSNFRINFIFDERQGKTIEANQSVLGIEVSQKMYDQLLKEYNQRSSAYKNGVSAYDKRVDEFESRLAIYNKKISTINSQGGATVKESQDLNKERLYLENLKNELGDTREALNDLVPEINILGDRVNAMAKELNIEVDVHNERFGTAREFDQGEYNGKEINIYQFDKLSDLRLVLAHELGHALGLDHVDNPKSVMYYLMDKQDSNDPVLSKEDVTAFTERCRSGNIFNIFK